MPVELPILKPMLAVASEPFDSSEYIFEIKWDGYRCLAYLNEGVKLLSRNSIEITETFPELGELSKLARDKPLILDGEIIVLENGVPSFNRLQSRARLKDKGKIIRAAASAPVLYMVFDILFVKDQLVVQEPLNIRKELLGKHVIPADYILISDYVLAKGKQFAAVCAAKGLEGVMAKQIESPYLPGKRSSFWKKIRNTREVDLVICGYQQGKGGRRLGSLVLGGYKDGGLVYQGKVGTGFDQKEEQKLLEMFMKLSAKNPVLEVPIVEFRRTRWLNPELVCVVQYLALTGDGLLRHPVYKGLRLDKQPVECNALDVNV